MRKLVWMVGLLAACAPAAVGGSHVPATGLVEGFEAHVQLGSYVDGAYRVHADVRTGGAAPGTRPSPCPAAAP
ncbi:MAG TPA: hypothetical protein VHG51_03220 [Longimicrobiaceae bacterium]|nr:hypothetical protein [Longimicrobiaceae bacterium]